MFSQAGLNVIIDHRALPGVAASGQMFAGNCTNQVEFYSSASMPLLPDYNYKRAVTWSIVMAFLSHAHAEFVTVFTIEAVNEPIQDASQTPGLGRFETAFVLGVRAIEYLLGITCDDTNSLEATGVLNNITLPALINAILIIKKLAIQYDLSNDTAGLDWSTLVGKNGQLSFGKLSTFLHGRKRTCLSTS